MFVYCRRHLGVDFILEDEMPIPESQLEAWSHRGALDGSASTHSSIRAALDRHSWPNGVTPSVYLQGSYRNYTNTRGNSDVDVVVETDSIYYYNTSRLTADELQLFRQDFSPATYDWTTFQSDAFPFVPQ
jgi:hypothetical protein